MLQRHVTFDTGIIGMEKKKKEIEPLMNNMIDIDVILDEAYIDPKVTIQTKEKTKQVEHIIQAIDYASDRDFPVVMAFRDEKVTLVSQRDVIRVFTHNKRVMLQTVDEVYLMKKSVTALEQILNPERFVRISQSEIINLYKVKSFDLTMRGSVGVEFEDGNKSWVSRNRLHAIREVLRKYRR